MNAKLSQYQAAIDDYTAVIDMTDVPSSLRAMSFYNRGLAYHATDRESEAIDDLNGVLHMCDAPNDVKTEARRKLLRMERASDRIST